MTDTHGSSRRHDMYVTSPTLCHYIQGSAKRWAVGCVNSLPAARGSQEADVTKPRVHLLADPCTHERTTLESPSHSFTILAHQNLGAKEQLIIVNGACVWPVMEIKQADSYRHCKGQSAQHSTVSPSECCGG